MQWGTESECMDRLALGGTAMVGPITRPKRGRPTAAYKEYPYWCPYQTDTKKSVGERNDPRLTDEPLKYALLDQTWIQNPTRMTCCQEDSRPCAFS
jgi:hypothetical protein